MFSTYLGEELPIMTDKPLRDAEIEQLDIPGPDPYPNLPLLEPAQLRDGDVLMMLGTGKTKIGRFHLPVSWMIRYLDGGAYSHSAVVSLIDGIPHVWDHSDDWKLAPVSLEQGIRKHAWCHVYRLHKHGASVGSDRYPPAPLVDALEQHRGETYDMYRLALAGVIALISNRPISPVKRDVLRRALNLLVMILDELWKEKKFDDGMLICTAVAGVSYWSALNSAPHDYALQADLQRRRHAAMPGVEADADWDRTIAALRDVLNRIFGNIDAQLVVYNKLLYASNADWVDIGSTALPATLVSPSDLEFSRTLERVGHLDIPG